MALSIPEHLQGKLDETISEVIEKGPDGIHWSFGGGSALECWIGHRQSEDIDIFLLDPQALPYFSPSREMVTITADYKEDHLTLKLLLPDYQIDLIASPPLLENPYENIDGIRIETPSEILAKKVFHRADEFKPRDYFDAAACFYVGINLDERCKEIFREKSETLLVRLSQFSLMLKTDEFKKSLDVYPPFKPVVENVESIFRDGLQEIQ